MLLGRLEFVEVDLRQSGDLARVETTFSVPKFWPNLTRSANTHGDFVGSSLYDEDKKIEEGIALLVRREKHGKKIFKCWTCNEVGHYASKCPKRENKSKGIFKLRGDRDRNCLYANEDE